MAPAFPLPGEPVDPVRGDGDDGGVPRHSLWRKVGAPPGRGQYRRFEPRHVGEGVGAVGWASSGRWGSDGLSRPTRTEHLNPGHPSCTSRTRIPELAHPHLLARAQPSRTCIPELVHPDRTSQTGWPVQVGGLGVFTSAWVGWFEGGCEARLRGPSCLRAPSARKVGALGFRCCVGDRGVRFGVRVVGNQAILYICSKVVCFLVSRPVVRPRCWPRPPGTRRRGL